MGVNVGVGVRVGVGVCVGDGVGVTVGDGVGKKGIMSETPSTDPF